MKVQINTIGALAFASTTPALACGSEAAFTGNHRAVELVMIQETEAKPFEMASLRSNLEHVLEEDNRIEEWSSKLDKEFRKLAAKEAFSEINDKEQQRLDDLAKARERLVYPRSAEEILAELQHEEMVKSLTQALEKYVRFREFTHNKAYRTGKAD